MSDRPSPSEPSPLRFPPGPEGADPLRWAEEERALVCALGGYAVQLSGGWLVTHERLPGPRFNFIEVGPVAPARRTAFIERALDHYFQRALRPSVRLSPSAPDEVIEALGRLGFRERAVPLQLLIGGPGPRRTPDAGRPVRPLTPAELPILYQFWGGPRELLEIRSSLDGAMAAPARGETVIPVTAVAGEGPVSVGILHGWNGLWGLHAVATVPGRRGDGWASELALGSLRLAQDPGPGRLGLRLDAERIPPRLAEAGFRALGSHRVFDLPHDRALEVPPPGPPQPPRWRPPRTTPR